jgi:hypothetical protein
MSAFGIVFLIAVGALLLSIAVWLVRRPFGTGMFLTVSVVQFTLCFLAFSAAFALGDGNEKVPELLKIGVAILSAPIMYLMYVPPTYFGRRWWGDDANFIIGLMFLNSVAWGFVAAFVQRRVKKY